MKDPSTVVSGPNEKFPIYFAVAGGLEIAFAPPKKLSKYSMQKLLG